MNWALKFKKVNSRHTWGTEKTEHKQNRNETEAQIEEQFLLEKSKKLIAVDPLPALSRRATHINR